MGTSKVAEKSKADHGAFDPDPAQGLDGFELSLASQGGGTARVAATFTDSTGNGAWEDDLNWSTGHVPDASTKVFLPASASATISGSNGPNVIASISIARTAELNIVTQDAVNHSTPVEFLQGGANAGTISLALQSQLTIDGAFNNTGTITVGEGGATDASSADYINANMVLSGGGTIDLHDGWIQGAPSGKTLTNVDNTISGYGFIGNGFTQNLPFSLNNQGIINANGVDAGGFDQSLVIQTGATTLVNTGILRATNPTNAAITGGLSLFQDTVNNVGGTIAAIGAHTHVDLTSTTVIGGTVETRNGGAVTFDGASLFDARSNHPLTIDGSLVVNAGASLNVAGTFDILAVDNSNILLTESSSGAADLVIATSGVVLNGGGSVTLGGGSADHIVGAGSGAVLYVAAATISGGGMIGGGDLLTLVNQAGGVVDATNPDFALTIDTGTNAITNKGLLEATAGGQLLVANATVNNAGTIFAGNNSVVTLQTAVVNGGTLTTAGSGIVDTVGVVTLNASAAAIVNQGLFADTSDVTIEGTLSNTGVLRLGGPDTLSNAFLRIGTATTLTGGGALILNDGPGDTFVIGAAAKTVLTNVDNTISGAGQLGDGQLTLINKAAGIVNANGADGMVLNAGSVTNFGLIEASGAGGLTIADSSVNDSSGGIIQALDHSSVILQNSTVIGGTLTTAGSGQIGISGSNTLDARTKAIANKGLIVDNGDLTIEGSLSNTGALHLAGTQGADIFLRIGAATNLHGGGALTLSDAPGNFVIGATAATVLTNVDNVISGAGQLGDGRLTLVNEEGGTINANGTNALVLDGGSSGSVTNDSLIEATGTGGLVISDKLDNSGGGIIGVFNQSSATLQNATLIGGVLATFGSAAITATGANTLDGRTSAITNKGSIVDSGDLTIEGSLSNSGALHVASTNGSNIILSIGAATTLSGGGALTLSDVPGSNFVIGATAATVLTNVDNIISGAGLLGDGQLTLINEAAGIINANAVNALTLDGGSSGSVTNFGLVEATGAGGLTISNKIDDSSGGLILVATGAHVRLANADVIGGTLQSVGTGSVQVDAASTVDGSTDAVTIKGSLDVLDHSTLSLEGTIDNLGRITVDDAGTFTELKMAADTVLSGGGKVVLTDSDTNIVTGVSFTATTLTNVDNTISGAGQLGAGDLKFVNQSGGVVNANGTHALVINSGGMSEGVDADVNDGLIEATGTGGLGILLTSMDDSGGGKLVAGNGSSILVSDSDIIGGTLNTAGTGVIAIQGLTSIDGRHFAVTNQGHINILDGSVLQMLGALKNTGQITLSGVDHPATFLAVQAVLSGGGTINLGNSSENVIEGTTTAEMLKNIDNTIAGAGHLGGGQMILINQTAGVIDGTFSTGLDIDTGSNVITNAGLIEATADGVTTIDSAVKNSGVLEANGGVLTVNGAVTGTGHLEIDGGTLDLSHGGVTNAVSFAGTTGTLQLDHSLTFSGSVSGFVKGETLDLSDVSFVKAGEASFSENSGGMSGVLTVTDGTHTAHITLSGDYSSSIFVAKSDGHGGTLVVTNAATQAVSDAFDFSKIPQATANLAPASSGHNDTDAQLHAAEGDANTAVAFEEANIVNCQGHHLATLGTHDTWFI
jgi:hypothetical protein